MGPLTGQPRILCVTGAAEVAAARALAGAVPLRFLSARGAGGFLGWAGFRALLAAEWPTAILDCADAPGHALAALRQGCPAVVLSPLVPGFAALGAIAVALEAALLPVRPSALDLGRLRLETPAGRAHFARHLALPVAAHMD